jgi:uroporphyrinogen decarboxylase
MSIKNDRLLRALRRETVDRTPVWMMRQAGRYLPEYLAVRKKEPNFMAFCRDIDAVCEVTLQPLERFPLDAAIIFSDILTVPEAMGAPLTIEPGRGPIVHQPIRDEKAVAALTTESVAELEYVFTAIRRVKQALAGRVPLFGFCGSPWTIASYMVEGGSSKLFHHLKRMIYSQPALAHQLLQKITDLTVVYLNEQVKAGADVLQVFDSWGGVLTPSAYREFSLRYMQQIVDRVERQRGDVQVPIILFTKGGGQWLELMADTGANGLGLDWTVDIASARTRVGDRVALQGNLDPAILLSTPEAVQRETQRILSAFGSGSGHIFNLGHGIDRHTPIENVQAMFEVLV